VATATDARVIGAGLVDKRPVPARLVESGSSAARPGCRSRCPTVGWVKPINWPSPEIDCSQTFQRRVALARPVRNNRMLQAISQIDPHRRHTIRVTLATALATSLLIAGSVLAWRFYAEWRLGRIELTNDGIPLELQVLSEVDDEPIGEPSDLVSRSTLALPAGDYRLRINAPGRLGQTYRFAVNRGETEIRPLSLDDSLLLGQARGARFPNGKRVPEQPTLFAPGTVALELEPGSADLIERNHHSFIRRDGLTGEVVWDALHPTKPFEKGRDPALWLRPFLGNTFEPVIVQPAVDLDGDSVADVVCAFVQTPSLLTLSGKDGSLLWTYTAELDGPGGPQPGGPVFARASSDVRPSNLVGTPDIVDCDRDGTPDVIATVAFSESLRELKQRSPDTQSAAAPGQNAPSRRVVIAVSGRSGRWIWSHAIEKTFTDISTSALQRGARVLAGRGAPTVTIQYNDQLIRLDSAMGRPLGAPLEIGFLPVREIGHADFDGDGEPDVLALGPGPKNNQQTLAAFATGTGRPLWSQTVMAPYASLYTSGPRLDWPLVIDSDGDGRCEVVVADSGTTALAGEYRGVSMIDGASGQTRWVRPMRPATKADDRIEHIAAAPDLDRDGILDLVLFSRFDGRQPATAPNIGPSAPEAIYVDAISGHDGHPLWWRRFEVEQERVFGIRAPLWWGRGPDGWPLLALNLGGRHEVDDGAPGDQPRIVHVLEASTGREVHRVEHLLCAGVADFDGDGLADLWGEADGQLRAFRGPMPEAWRSLGYFEAAGRQVQSQEDGENHIADFDGDGINDALAATFDSPSTPNAPGTRTLVARSGRDGRALWKTSVVPPRVWGGKERWARYEAKTFPLPSGDLDGDGTCDVLVTSQLMSSEAGNRAATIPLELLSGRTGRRLWSAGGPPLGLEGTGHWQIRGLTVCRVEPNGAPAIVAAVIRWPWIPGMTRSPGDRFEARLMRFAGRDGRVVWDKPLLDHPYSRTGQGIPDLNLADLNGDGSLDVTVLIPLSIPQETRGFELRAVALRDGARLWSRKIPTDHPADFPTLLVVDLDGDNRAEIVVLSTQSTAGNKVERVLEALSGRDGSTLWSWRDGSEDPWTPQWGGSLCGVDFDGTRNRKACLGLSKPGIGHRIVIFDAAGRQLAHRDLSKGQIFALRAADVNGDGRDELVVSLEHRLQVLGKDLQEIWSRPQDQHEAGFIYLPSAEMTPTLAIQPPLGLDAANGLARWAGEARASPYTVFALFVLDPGNATRPPLLFSTASRAVCYQALPATPAGKYAPPQGTPVPPGLAKNDPRWTRPLPWVTRLSGSTGPWVALACSGLALVNVLLPLLILRFATRRRPWTIRVLSALPVAAAVPLMAYLVLEPMIEARPDSLFASTKLQFILGTLAGIPLIFLAAVAAWALLHRRAKTLAALTALSLAASAVIAAIWLWVDMKSMPAIEQYGPPGWYLIALPGVYASGLIELIKWLIRRAARLPQRVRRRRMGETHQLPVS
jgi:hypothetical protein